jgi:peroxiredoxin
VPVTVDDEHAERAVYAIRPSAQWRRTMTTGHSRPRATRVLLTALLLVGLAASPVAALGPGDRAPDFALKSLDGKSKVSLRSYRGKVVWLDFWASWCAPCLKALPDLEKMRQRVPAKHVQLLAVNLDQDLKKARKFLKKSPIGYPSASDPEGKVPEQFGVENMPTSFLIDRKGVIRYVHKGYRSGDIEEIEAEIEKAVKAR